MKIAELVLTDTKLSLFLTNEERDFINHHGNKVRITALDEHEQWLAQNLVRKGAYKVSKDSNTLIGQVNEHR